MLPNRMQLSRKTEDQLKKIKSHTGITPNITARIGFFRSIESEFRYSTSNEFQKLDGSLILDKITWLGETAKATELTLFLLYPNLADKDIIKAWAAHVDDGISSLRSCKNLVDFISLIKK